MVTAAPFSCGNPLSAQCSVDELFLTRCAIRSMAFVLAVGFKLRNPNISLAHPLEIAEDNLVYRVGCLLILNDVRLLGMR